MFLDAKNVATFLAFGNFLFAFVVSIYIANLREPNPALRFRTAPMAQKQNCWQACQVQTAGWARCQAAN